MKARIVANGTDDIFDLVNNFWGQELETRVAPVFQQRGYQVLSNEVTRSFDVWAHLGNTYPYQIVLELETGVSASSTSALHELVRSVLLQVTGYEPSAIAITSAGQPAPEPPTTLIDTTIDAGGSLIGETVTGVRVLQAAIVIGAVVLLYWAVTNPAKVARIVR